MHEFLRSVGYLSCNSKKKVHELIQSVLDDPMRLSILSYEEDTNLAVCESEAASGAGITVVGEVNEQGNVVPEYYFPFLTTNEISSEAEITYKKDSGRDGFIGMCEDYRMGMALIFEVHNIADVLKREMNPGMSGRFTGVSFSLLCSDATVLLPLLAPKYAYQKGREEEERHTKLIEDAQSGNSEAIEKLAAEDIEAYQKVLDRLKSSDVFTVVESFIIPYGMESNHYYVLSEILKVDECVNRYTDEHFYRMKLRANGMVFAAAVNREDILGIPYEGARLKCHGWLLGDLRG